MYDAVTAKKVIMTTLATRTLLYAHFDRLGLSYSTLEHMPVFSVEEGAQIKAALPGGHTKNLFLKDKSGAFFLLCALGTTQVPLNHLHKALGCGRLSFGSADMMMEVLGVTPGSVTLFGLISETKRQITLVLDEALLITDPVNFHPLINSATTTMSQTDLQTFIAHWGGTVFGCDFSGELPIARRLVLAV
jgi:Ala-tRNA(Pro) deacylase